MKKALNISYWIILIILLVVAGVVSLTAKNLPGGVKIFTVLSGSMEPKIPMGSLVLVAKSQEYMVGDSITATDSLNPNTTVTHRIYEVKNDNDKKVYITKGDSNDAPDSDLRPESTILGKVVFTVPLLGYLVNFSKTKSGLIFLIIIPSTLIIYSELMAMKNEVSKLLAVRKKRKLNLAEKIELQIGQEEIKVDKWYRRIFRK
jgi:signal peptidase